MDTRPNVKMFTLITHHIAAKAEYSLTDIVIYCAMHRIFNANNILVLKIARYQQWRIQKFWKGGGRQFISSVLIHRKCAQRNYMPFTRKKRFFEQKYEPIGGQPPPPPWIRHWIYQAGLQLRCNYALRKKLVSCLKYTGWVLHFINHSNDSIRSYEIQTAQRIA